MADAAWAARWERFDGGEITPPPRAQRRQMEREGSRGGESEAKALAGAGRSRGERSEVGLRRRCAERLTRERASENPRRT